jgi:hypothetical protein
MNSIAFFRDWGVMRWLRLLLGLYFAYQAFLLKDSFSGFVASFFLLQAITNTGCCGSGGCGVPTQKYTENKPENIEYEIIKPK